MAAIEKIKFSHRHTQTSAENKDLFQYQIN